MNFAQGPEQAPIPCRNCGAPMKEHGVASLVGPVQVICPYCKNVEQLPQDQAQRVMALRARLAQLRWAKQAEEAPALSFAQTMQALRKNALVYAGMGLFVVGTSLVSAIQQVAKAVGAHDLSSEVREEILASGLVFPCVSVGAFIGVAAGYALALMQYRKAVVPQLRARAPRQPGMPARCRSCGASLAVGQLAGAFVPCGHCGANNLITDDLTTDRVRHLEQEARGYNERAAGVMAQVNEAAPKFQTYFFIGGGVGAASAALFGGAVYTLIKIAWL